MQSMGNQADAQDQFKDDGQSCNDERKVETEKMVAIDVNLEAIHVDNLQDSRHNEHKAQQNL